MPDQKKRPPARKLFATAALLGVIAGAAAVYVKETGSGNGGDAPTADASCPLAAQKVASLTPLMRGQVAAMTPAANARPIGGLDFAGPDGKPLTLAAFAGKTVLVNLWATWCVPCREEMPALNALQQALGGDRFEVVAINIDTGADDKPKAFLDEVGVQALGYYRDASMGVFNTLKKEGLAFGLPATLLLDEKGCLIGSMNGPAAWDSDDAKKLIEAAMAPPAAS
ncbi:redoxin family protein [Sinorhizobium medicae]|uniref:thiol:disulfide interchange protein TlpA n=1 Tax=Sinorhizobium medicae TaxID=110321 RepID=UPI00041AFCC0|nr:TlpA disulfide reductase family protein [Sinorhizobium medicae]MBO1943262.1 TlpA family protein disulfide reductase [Sinorhizobium medicae]MDX0429120.1 redoxin family protein [Sinorhizobium medicae]MDX0441899.1 redoxin family protein [Sinorhizobium medicae]MDX0462735.1 redoxin family protein [Sinorhizobium medicae]MDX0487888.1 redoxin family protein [Sinorhizobium medicae]